MRCNGYSCGITGQITTRSYVQDGLVHMWDGIENKDYGYHCANISSWKDLIGNCDFQITDSDSVGDSYFINKSIKTGNIETITDFTIEIIGYYLSYKSSTNAIVLLNEDSWKETIAFHAYTWYFWSAIRGVSYRGELSAKTYPTLMSWTNSNTSQNCYSNAELFYTDSRTVTLPEKNMIKLGGNDDACIPFQYYSIRIYNRVLSSSEIMHNYSIDKLRFNLP